MRHRMQSNPIMREVPIPACLSTSVELGDQWHAFGMSTNEPEAFAGIHARRVLLIVDEASGVDEKIYEAGEGFLTGTGARVLLIGNPTKPSGQFYRAFTSERADWNTLHISAPQSPNFTGEAALMDPDVASRIVTQAWVEDKKRRWGEESTLYQVRVGKIVGHTRLALKQPAVLRVRVVVDDDGVGGGVTDRLRESLQEELRSERADLVPYRGGEKAIRPERFTNKRTESWFRAKWAMDSLDIPNDDDLAADLVSVLYKMTSSGQLQAERKDDVKKRLMRSPDRGDALVMLLEPERQRAVIDPMITTGGEEGAYDIDW
jgi:hypothetical protein